MENNFWLYIILIPIIVNIISTALYEFVKPRFAKWKSKTSFSVAQSRIEEINEHINEVKKYKNDNELTLKVGLREILRAFWSVFITGLAIILYFFVQFVIISLATDNRISSDFSESFLNALPYISLGFFWGHFNKSNRRVLFYYRLIRDVIDYDAFIERRTTDINYFKQNLKKLSKGEKD